MNGCPNELGTRQLLLRVEPLLDHFEPPGSDVATELRAIPLPYVLGLLAGIAVPSPQRISLGCREDSEPVAIEMPANEFEAWIGIVQMLQNIHAQNERKGLIEIHIGGLEIR